MADEQENPDQPAPISVKPQASDPVDAEFAEAPADPVRESRALIPVTQTGVTPQDFAQQVDYAKAMAKARAALPDHLRDNVGDCLAIIDISNRVGLSPYMVANKTYVQNGRLCFESQLFHAFAQSSGLLKGDLEVTYEGEGDERVCIVTGYLRSDPRTPRHHRSPKLGDLHPGYSLKTERDGVKSTKHLSYAEGQKMKAEAKANGTTISGLFSKGSPLWDRKPDVQMFYDTSRDWVRLFAPRATLGIYTPEEMQEYPEIEDRAARAPEGGRLAERLKNGGGIAGEGHKPGHAAEQLAQIAPSIGKTQIKAHPESGPPAAGNKSPATPAAPTSKKPTSGKKKPDAKATKAVARAAADRAAAPDRSAAAIKAKAAATAAADRAEATSRSRQAAAQHANAGPPPPETKKPMKQPTNLDEYEAYFRNWLANENNPDQIEARWDGEYELRDDCKVPISKRKELQRIADDKVSQLRNQ